MPKFAEIPTSEKELNEPTIKELDSLEHSQIEVIEGPEGKRIKAKLEKDDSEKNMEETLKKHGVDSIQ